MTCTGAAGKKEKQNKIFPHLLFLFRKDLLTEACLLEGRWDQCKSYSMNRCAGNSPRSSIYGHSLGYDDVLTQIVDNNTENRIDIQSYNCAEVYLMDSRNLEIMDQLLRYNEFRAEMGTGGC